MAPASRSSFAARRVMAVLLAANAVWLGRGAVTTPEMRWPLAVVAALSLISALVLWVAGDSLLARRDAASAVSAPRLLLGGPLLAAVVFITLCVVLAGLIVWAGGRLWR